MPSVCIGQKRMSDGSMHGCEPQGMLGAKVGPLQDQQVLLTNEPSLKLPESLHFSWQVINKRMYRAQCIVLIHAYIVE